MHAYSDTIFRLIEYETWCNLRAIDFLAGLSDAECKRDFKFGLRTPHRTIFHIVDVIRERRVPGRSYAHHPIHI
jgi:uncharacterized damage-inducible protein DinB